MIHAEFWHWGTDGRLRPACGSDSVLLIDGRYGVARQHATAREHGARLGRHIAYVLRAGRSFSDSRPLMSMPAWLRVNSVPTGRPVHPSEVHPDFLSGGRVI